MTTQATHTADTMSWKHFTVRIIDALRWPAALIAVAVIFREPIWQLVTGLARAVSA